MIENDGSNSDFYSVEPNVYRAFFPLSVCHNVTR